MDKWLIQNCPIYFIQKRLKEQYGDDYDDIKNGNFDMVILIPLNLID